MYGRYSVAGTMGASRRMMGKRVEFLKDPYPTSGVLPSSRGRRRNPNSLPHPPRLLRPLIFVSGLARGRRVGLIGDPHEVVQAQRVETLLHLGADLIAWRRYNLRHVTLTSDAVAVTAERVDSQRASSRPRTRATLSAHP